MFELFKLINVRRADLLRDTSELEIVYFFEKSVQICFTATFLGNNIIINFARFMCCFEFFI